MKWNLSSDRPIYIQLVEQITQQIASGELEIGEKLPSVRDLAQAASVNPNTMQKALAELERQGLVYTQRTLGKFITEDKEIVDNMKAQTASAEITAFFEKMKQMGFDAQQTMDLIHKMQYDTN